MEHISFKGLANLTFMEYQHTILHFQYNLLSILWMVSTLWAFKHGHIGYMESFIFITSFGVTDIRETTKPRQAAYQAKYFDHICNITFAYANKVCGTFSPTLHH